MNLTLNTILIKPLPNDIYNQKHSIFSILHFQLLKLTIGLIQDTFHRSHDNLGLDHHGNTILVITYPYLHILSPFKHVTGHRAREKTRDTSAARYPSSLSLSPSNEHINRIFYRPVEYVSGSGLLSCSYQNPIPLHTMPRTTYRTCPATI